MEVHKHFFHICESYVLNAFQSSALIFFSPPRQQQVPYENQTLIGDALSNVTATASETASEFWQDFSTFVFLSLVPPPLIWSHPRSGMVPLRSPRRQYGEGDIYGALQPFGPREHVREGTYIFFGGGGQYCPPLQTNTVFDMRASSGPECYLFLN